MADALKASKQSELLSGSCSHFELVEDEAGSKGCCCKHNVVQRKEIVVRERSSTVRCSYTKFKNRKISLVLGTWVITITLWRVTETGRGRLGDWYHSVPWPGGWLPCCAVFVKIYGPVLCVCTFPYICYTSRDSFLPKVSVVYLEASSG